jgi:23S rRNA pseudouridine2605 synthase
MERLQKIIAAAGVASRRKAEQMISAGRVTVNGKIVAELGTKADPVQDHIKVDGKLLRAAEEKIYLVLHKPRGYVTTVTDPEGRPTVMNLIQAGGRHAIKQRVYPVGRLDWASEGLLLMINDGALAHQLTRAASHVTKTYEVKISGRPSEAELAKLRSGIVLRDDPKQPAITPRTKTAPAGIRLLRDAPNPWYEVTLIEGRNRQIRRMFEQVGHHVEKIKRVRYGPLQLDVEPGEWRALSVAEVRSLQSAVQSGRALRPGSSSSRIPSSPAHLVIQK